MVVEVVIVAAVVVIIVVAVADGTYLLEVEFAAQDGGLFSHGAKLRARLFKFCGLTRVVVIIVVMVVEVVIVVAVVVVIVVAVV